MLLSFLTVGCADRRVVNNDNHADLAAAIPVCDVISHPAKYDGHEIAVVGIYGNAPHQRILFDPDCTPGELQLRIAGDKDSFDKDNQLQSELKNRDQYRTKAVYRGRIEAEKYVSPCSGASCYRVAINDALLLSTERVAPR